MILDKHGTPFTTSNDELVQACAAHRALAKRMPINKTRMAMMAQDNRLFLPYRFRYGKWRLAVTYETVTGKRLWHAQVGIMEDLNELQYGATEQGLLAVTSWSAADFKQAEELLAECLAPEMKRESQWKQGHKGTMFVHLFVEDESSPTAQGVEIGH